MEPQSSIARRIRPLATGRTVIITGVCFAVFATIFFATSAPFAIPHVEKVCGAAPLDVRFHSTAADVQRFLDACGQDGRAAYRNLQIADLVYPTAFGLFMTSALAMALKHLVPRRPNLVGLAVIGLVGSGFDYLENLFAWRVLATYPDIGASGTLLGFASAAKTTSSWIAGIALLGCVVALTVRTIRRLLASPRASRPVPTPS